MERVDPAKVAEALLASAGWARLSLTAPSQWLREQAAKELALTIVDHLTGEDLAVDVNQLALPI